MEMFFFVIAGVNRQLSSVESLPHMLTRDTPPGKLPLFASWSLVQLGSSFLYSHSTGVNQVMSNPKYSLVYIHKYDHPCLLKFAIPVKLLRQSLRK